MIIKDTDAKGTIKSQYNFGDKQNPEIDKFFNHVLGRNVYFITKEPEKTMYITAIYPYLTLEVKLKMYTDNTEIIDAFNSGKKIYFGFDLLIENIDALVLDNTYHTDIMICIFDKYDVECHDYIDNTQHEQYEINDGGATLNNNLIPLGFTNIELNHIQENVIDYKNYFQIKFEKEYPPLFDNITMFNWINYVASDTGDGIKGFYGIVRSGMDISTIPYSSTHSFKPIYLEKHLFIDGEGLEEDHSSFLNVKYLLFKYFFLFYFINFNFMY
jgi:hypothetical protein